MTPMNTTKYYRNPELHGGMLPVDIVLHPCWWHAHAGITFDEDFFYHPAKRVESERRMEQVLHERFGRHGLGADHDRDLPLIGAVHNAAGFMISEMLGCEVRYKADGAPDVVPAHRESLEVDADQAFRSAAAKRYEHLRDQLKTRHGRVLGDINWGGVLNVALDLRGQEIFLDMLDNARRAKVQFRMLAEVLDRFTTGLQAETGTSSISVNRNVRHFREPVFLHSECSHTMISVKDYEEFLMPIDAEWSAAPSAVRHPSLRQGPASLCGVLCETAAAGFPRPRLGWRRRPAAPPSAAHVLQHPARSGEHRGPDARRNPRNHHPARSAIGQSLAHGRLLHQHGPHRQRRPDQRHF